MTTGLFRNTVVGDLPGLSWWLERGFWAVTDYGLFASSNFVLNLLLARWLAPSDYGAFTVGFTIFLLLGTFHTGLFLEPMLVFGAERNRHRLPDYLRTVLLGHLGFVVVAALVCFVVGLGLWLAGSRALYPTLFSLAFAAPWILLLWLMRTTCYVHLTIHFAAAGGLLYLLLMVAGASALHLRDWLSPVSAIGVMGLSSLAAGLWLAARVKQPLPRVREGKAVHDTMSMHWRFGRWTIGVNLLYWFITSSWYILLPVSGGLAASGAFRALVIFIMPPVFALYAVSRVLMGGLVRTRGDSRFEHLVRVTLLFSISVSTLYWLLLGGFGGSLLSWLYGGQYGEYKNLLWILGAALILDGVRTVLYAALQSLERPDLVFWAHLFSSLVVCFVGLPLALALGVWGAGIGFLLSTLVSAGSMWMFFGRVGRGSEWQPAAVELLAQRDPSRPA